MPTLLLRTQLIRLLIDAVLLGFFQISTNLTLVLNIPWPNTFKSFVQLFNVFNLDFIQWSSVSCVTVIDFYLKMILFTVIPSEILSPVLCRD